MGFFRITGETDKKERTCDWCYKPIKENKYNKLHHGKPVCPKCAMLFDVVDVHIE